MLERRISPTNRFIPFTRAETERSIPSRFERQVSRYPQRLAVIADHTSLTYTALDRAANRVAQAILTRTGAAPGPVGLLLGHDTPVLAAMLGVLKAGKICVPLDPQAPQERLRYILTDSQAALLVTDEMHDAVASALALPGCAVSCLEELMARGADETPGVPLAADDLAYLLYTSGSTGRPKGVAKSHRTVLHEVGRLTNAFHLCADDRHTLLRSVSSNGAIQDIYDSLLNGGVVCLFPLEREGVGRLASWLRQHEITIYRSAATVFRAFVQTLAGSLPLRRLRLIQPGGEPLSPQDVALYQRYFAPDCLLVNCLGLTETGPVCMYFMDQASRVPDAAVPVGHPVEDTEILLLDEAGQEVVAGDSGEIAVRSRFLASGYWCNPEATRTAFLPDPAGGDRRIFRTNDLGRLLPNGCLVHLGRMDSQVKVRGQRIEAAEVEGALLELNGVQEAVVMAREDRPGDIRLVAYLVAASSPRPSSTSLRQALAATMPGFMIPSVFVWLDAVPRLPGGKVDRRALPPPDSARPELTTPFSAPRTPIEDLLAGLWAESLGLEQVGVHDDFFELGGHSLLATHLLSRLRDAFQVELPLECLFDAPTVASLALAIVQRQAEQVGHNDVVRLLTEVEAASDAEAQGSLADEGIVADSGKNDVAHPRQSRFSP
ncbi:MAG TPA: non-ribosomal peptide synthetase [Candidatus Tectomicrobia bacterium]|nr:non-ribosomal peptide synthetase [Candidatus Tectomicrobia bacterium]